MPDLVLCDNCGEPAKYRGKKLCARCYQRFQAHGDFDLHTRAQQVCLVLGCPEPVKAYGYCTKHWRRLQTHGDTEDRKWSRRGSDRCVVPGCGGEHRSMGLCAKHYRDEQRRGHPIWKTLDKQKVHGDRPWTAESVRDPNKLYPQQSLTRSARSMCTESQGDTMAAEPLVIEEVHTCPACAEEVFPVQCGERTNGQVCTDLLCPECGEELPLSA